LPAGMMPEPPGCGLYLSARGRRTRSAAGEYPRPTAPFKGARLAAAIVIVSGKSKALEFRSMNQRISRNAVSRVRVSLFVVTDPTNFKPSPLLEIKKSRYHSCRCWQM
jgi:hypothetical protein